MRPLPWVAVAFVMPILLGFAIPQSASAVDADAARALARQNNCFKCHGIDKEKDGPAWKKVAEKYKDKTDAQARLIQHLTMPVSNECFSAFINLLIIGCKDHLIS